MGVAEAILDSIGGKEEADKDELGIPIIDDPKYYVGRFLRLQELEKHRTKLPDMHFVYQYQGVLYENHRPLERTERNFHRLTKCYRNVPRYVQNYFWDALLEEAPTFDPNIIEVRPGKLWDIKRHEWRTRYSMRPPVVE